MSASKFYNGVDLQSQKAINVADPSIGTDAANKQYVDNLAAGLPWKEAVRAATTANGALATAYANGQSIDGVTLVTGDRILLKNQTTAAENGIYVVAASGAPARAADANSAAELSPAVVSIEEGTTNGDKAYQQTAELTSLSDSQVWSIFNAGQTYTGSNGVTLVGADFRAVADPTADNITVGAGGISVKAGSFPRKYAQDIGAMTGGTPVTITHSLNTLDVVVETRIVATGELVDLNPVVTGVNTITVVAAASQSSGVLRVVVIG